MLAKYVPHRPNLSETSPNRVDWIEVAKGVMISFVVFGHTWRGLYTADLIPHELFHAVDARIYAFHMPVFFALSGWFFIGSINRKSLPEFAAGRAKRLLWPMVLWTYVFLFLKAIAGQYQNAPSGFGEMLIWPIPGILHFWFIWALLVLSFAFFPLKSLSHHPKAMTIAIGASFVGSLALRFIEWDQTILEWFGQAIQNAPFFLAGVLLGYAGTLDRISEGIKAIAVILSVVFVSAWPVIDAQGYALAGSLLLSLFVIVACATVGPVDELHFRGWIGFIGRASMPIYLTHTIFSAALRELLLALGVTNLATQLTLGTLVGVLGPLILLYLARRTRTVQALGF